MFIIYLGLLDFPLLSNSDIFSPTSWHVALVMDDKAELNASLAICKLPARVLKATSCAAVLHLAKEYHC